MLLLTPAHLTTILTTPSLLHTNSLVTTLLSLSPQLLAGSASDWSLPFAQLLYQCLAVAKIDKEVTDGEMISLVMEARDKASLPWYTVMETVKKLLSGGEDRKVSIQLLLSLSPPLERGMSEEAAQNKESLLTQLGPRSLQFLLQTASLSLDLKLVWDNPAIQDRTGADIPRDFPRACKEKSDTSILHLLSFVFNYKSMAQIAEVEVEEGT